LWVRGVLDVLRHHTVGPVVSGLRTLRTGSLKT
jgi:hypothetical protein